jgi:hypothetical protein
MPPKNKGFNVPNKYEPRSTRFFNYLYRMIKEADPSLLEREDVHKAYNELVECCFNYSGQIISRIPPAYSIYGHYNILMPYDHPKINDFLNNSLDDSNAKEIPNYFVVDEDKLVINNSCIPIFFSFDLDTADKVKIAMTIRSDITKKYTTLYELIKRDVIPYMNRTQWKRERDIFIPRLNRQIDRCNKDIKEYEEKIAYKQYLIMNIIKQIQLLDEPIITKFRD